MSSEEHAGRARARMQDDAALLPINSLHSSPRSTPSSPAERESLTSSHPVVAHSTTGNLSPRARSGRVDLAGVPTGTSGEVSAHRAASSSPSHLLSAFASGADSGRRPDEDAGVGYGGRLPVTPINTSPHVSRSNLFRDLQDHAPADIRITSARKLQKLELLALARYYANLAEQSEDDAHESSEEFAQFGNLPAQSARAFALGNRSADDVHVREHADPVEVAPPSVVSIAVPTDEGPSRPKGKTIDPRNWGNVSFAHEWSENDLEAQRRALDTFAEVNKFPKLVPEQASEAPRMSAASPNNTHSRPIQDAEPTSRNTRVAPSPARVKSVNIPGQVTAEEYAAVLEHISRLEKELLEKQHRTEPARKSRDRDVRNRDEKRNSKRSHRALPRQLAAESFIAKAIRGISKVNSAPPPSDPSDSSSSSESNDLGAGGDGENRSEDGRASSTRLRDSSSSRRSRHPADSHRMRIRPKEPTVYNGESNATAFHRFVREGTAYVEMGRIPASRQPFYLSYFLTGTAADFYNQVVVPNEREYNLGRFFLGLYEFCFPTDFRMQQRRRLDELQQDDRTVAATVALFSELWNTIGITDSQEKVVKLWNSFDDDIQVEMYRDKLNPEYSTWAEVVRGATHAEIIVNLARPSYSSGSDEEDDIEEDDPEDEENVENLEVQGGGRVNAPHGPSMTTAAENGSAMDAQDAEREPGLAAHGVYLVDDEMDILETNEEYDSTLYLGAVVLGDDEVLTPFESLVEDSGAVEAIYFDFVLSNGSLAQPIGDLRARYAELLLHRAQPYPADRQFEMNRRRFTITRVSATQHSVTDLLTGGCTEIESARLADADFDMPAWYAGLQLAAMQLDTSQPYLEEYHFVAMGNALAEGARLVLECAHRRGTISNDPQFQIYEEELGELTVVDMALVNRVYFPRQFLHDETFDLVAWYEQTVRDSVRWSDSGEDVPSSPGARHLEMLDVDFVDERLVMSSPQNAALTIESSTELAPLVDYESSDDESEVFGSLGELGYPDDAEEIVSLRTSVVAERGEPTRAIGPLGAPLGAFPSPPRGFSGSATSAATPVGDSLSYSAQLVERSLAFNSDSNGTFNVVRLPYTSPLRQYDDSSESSSRFRSPAQIGAQYTQFGSQRLGDPKEGGSPFEFFDSSGMRALHDGGVKQAVERSRGSGAVNEHRATSFGGRNRDASSYSLEMGLQTGGLESALVEGRGFDEEEEAQESEHVGVDNGTEGESATQSTGYALTFNLPSTSTTLDSIPASMTLDSTTITTFHPSTRDAHAEHLDFTIDDTMDDTL
ncbi:hypothetical protein C8F01DRAFT_1311981 [Mycena amicta]|nr:hypothetical protein C8F01DRAFT_1311981 [Mycena amicta]